MANFLLEPNAGLTDRYIRITLGSLMLACGAARLARQPDLTGAVLGLLGGMTLADGVLGTCPMYVPLGVDTRAPDVRHAGHEHTNDTIGPYEGI